MNFSDIRGVVIDMDGVLWRGDEPLPGMAAMFDFLRSRKLAFVLATNNSSKSPADYLVKLARMNVTSVAERQIVTSGTATLDYLQTHYPQGTTVHVLGGDGLRQLVHEAGFTLSENSAEIVIVGMDPHLTYDRLKRAAFAIRAGATFIGTNADATYPVPEGLAPGAGSLLAALQTATDRAPLVIGKPGKPMFEAALRLLGTVGRQTLMIGDRLNTDIIGAQQAGLKTAMVLTGISTRDEVASSPEKPDAIYNDLTALMGAWDE